MAYHIYLNSMVSSHAKAAVMASWRIATVTSAMSSSWATTVMASLLSMMTTLRDDKNLWLMLLWWLHHVLWTWHPHHLRLHSWLTVLLWRLHSWLTILLWRKHLWLTKLLLWWVSSNWLTHLHLVGLSLHWVRLLHQPTMMSSAVAVMATSTAVLIVRPVMIIELNTTMMATTAASTDYDPNKE